MNKEIKNPVEDNVKELLKDSMLEKISGGTVDRDAPICPHCNTTMEKDGSSMGWLCPNCDR